MKLIEKTDDSKGLKQNKVKFRPFFSVTINFHKYKLTYPEGGKLAILLCAWLVKIWSFGYMAITSSDMQKTSAALFIYTRAWSQPVGCSIFNPNHRHLARPLS